MEAHKHSGLVRVLAVLAALALVGAACDTDDEDAADEAPTETTAPADEGPTETTAPADGDDGGDEEEATAQDSEVQGTISASDQESDGSTVVVESATLEGGGGFVVVHADADGAPGEVVGHAAIPEGDSTDIAVELDRTIESGTYWPMLHVDAGAVGTYEFPGPDAPVVSGGEIVMTPIEVTVS